MKETKKKAEKKESINKMLLMQQPRNNNHPPLIILTSEGIVLSLTVVAPQSIHWMPCSLLQFLTTVKAG